MNKWKKLERQSLLRGEDGQMIWHDLNSEVGDEDEDLDFFDERKEYTNGSTLGSGFNLMATAVGSGILSLRK
jgi:hypothetical protein